MQQEQILDIFRTLLEKLDSCHIQIIAIIVIACIFAYKVIQVKLEFNHKQFETIYHNQKDLANKKTKKGKK